MARRQSQYSVYASADARRFKLRGEYAAVYRRDLKSTYDGGADTECAHSGQRFRYSRGQFSYQSATGSSGRRRDCEPDKYFLDSDRRAGSEHEYFRGAGGG